MREKFLKLLLTGFVLMCPFMAKAQEIDFEKRAVKEIESYEAKHNGSLTERLNHFGLLKQPHLDTKTIMSTKALIFRRTNDAFDPQLHVWYFLDKDTDALKGIEYNWGLFNPSFNPSENKEKLEALTKKEKQFRKKYKALMQEISQEMGRPFRERIIADHAYELSKQIFWTDEEKIVELSMEFHRKIQEVPGIGILGDFHVSVMITYL